MSLTSSIFITLVVVFCSTDISAKESVNILLTAYDCEVLDSKLVFNYTCSLTNGLGKLNQTTILRSQTLNLQRNVKLYNYFVHLKLFRKFGNVFRPYLINIDQDMCAVLGKGRNSKDVSLLRKLINFDTNRSHGNFYEPCPFSGTRYEKDVETQSNLIGLLGMYRMDITGYTMVNGIRTNLTFSQISGTIRIKS